MESNKQKETKQDTSTLPNKEELSEDIIDINKVLETLEPEKRSKIVSAFMALETEHSFRGPLPAPEDFKAYGEVIPDAPERILCLMEQQVEHRISTERNIVTSGLKESRRGQWMGYSIVVILIGLSTLLAFYGHDVTAGIMITAAIGLAVVFVLKQNPHEKEQDGVEKDKLLGLSFPV